MTPPVLTRYRPPCRQHYWPSLLCTVHFQCALCMYGSNKYRADSLHDLSDITAIFVNHFMAVHNTVNCQSNRGPCLVSLWLPVGFTVQAVPVEEQLEALSKAVSAGKIRHVGLSNETAWGLMKFLQFGEIHMNNVGSVIAFGLKTFSCSRGSDVWRANDMHDKQYPAAIFIRVLAVQQEC